MTHHIISKLQGTIIVITILIAVTLGMTAPSTVLGGKPLPDYVDVVMMVCSDLTYDVYVWVYFYEVQKDGSETFIGAATPSTLQQGTIDADSMIPIRKKPGKWEVWVDFYYPDTYNPACKNGPDTGTSFPATINYTCENTAGSTTATVTIGIPKVFP